VAEVMAEAGDTNVFDGVVKVGGVFEWMNEGIVSIVGVSGRRGR